MSPDDISEIIEPYPASWFMLATKAQALAIYRKACFDRSIRELLPKMKITRLVGDSTASFSIASFWQMQDDDLTNGGGMVNFRMIRGANHFVHWDNPEMALQVYIDALDLFRQAIVIIHFELRPSGDYS